MDGSAHGKQGKTIQNYPNRSGRLWRSLTDETSSVVRCDMREATEMKESSRAVLLEIGASQNEDRRSRQFSKPSLFENDLRPQMDSPKPTAAADCHEAGHRHPCGM